MPRRSPPTHFLCIPLVTASSRQQLASSLDVFTADVSRSDGFAVPAEAVRPIGTLHLTLGVMSFPNNQGLGKAVDVLKSMVPRNILAEIEKPGRPVDGPASEGGGLLRPRSRPLTVTLRGLQTMGSASKATVLYAPPVDEQGILRQFCEKVKAAFSREGLMTDETRPLLLHVTVVNTSYVRAPRSGKKRERVTIDARGILSRYDDYVWMENIAIDKVAICRMGAKQQEDGDVAYEVEAEVEVGALHQG